MDGQAASWVQFADLGVIVLFLAMLIRGDVRTGREMKYVEVELANARAELKTAREDLKAVSEKSLESIIRSTLAMERVIPLLDQRPHNKALES